MATQYAGLNSTGDRRRRRIVVNGEGTGIEPAIVEGHGSEIESQLVASAAAGPWVPANESRIWIFAGLIGLLLGIMTYVWAQPNVVHESVSPLSNHLLTRANPILILGAEVLFLALSAQLSHLIGWYRSRGRLDFAGRYRFWPWATGLFIFAAFGVATNSHRALGEVIRNTEALTWRSHTVSWLLPICLAALPIVIFLDRDIRNSRSSLWTVRCSVVLWIVEAWMEVFRPELQTQPYFETTFLLIPLIASAVMFVGLWLHARVVAYVCPDPPELNERSAWSLLVAAFGFTIGLLMFWRKRDSSGEEDDSKPKRRRKKVEPSEEVAAKRKRKAPAKKPTTRTRTRTKLSDDEAVDDQSDLSNDQEIESTNEPTEENAAEAESHWEESQETSEQWEEEAVEATKSTQNSVNSRGNGRATQVHKPHGNSVPAPHSRQHSQSWDEEESSSSEENSKSVSNQSYEESEEDRQFQLESGMTADQMKGMSKRQKRELKKQLREQERSRGR